MAKIAPGNLERFCVTTLTKYGMRDSDAQLTAQILVGTDMLGVFTHGTKLLRGYLKRLRAGGINATAKPEVVREGPSWAVVDGHSAMGMVTSTRAMDLAIEKAKRTGIAYVGTKNSCHFGAAGAYALRAAKQGLIGLAMSNDTPSMVAPGARRPVLGTNPFAVAIPAGKEKIVLLDIALSTVAGSKVYAASMLGKPIPNTWIVDRDGLPTTDGKLYPHEAFMMPMAGHKGYGLAFMVETLAGLLTGGSCRGEILSWLFDQHDQPTGHCHAFLAIDVGSIVPMDLYKDRIDKIIQDIHDTPKAKGSERIFLPGEMEWENLERTKRDGLSLPQDVVEYLDEVARDAGLRLDEFLEK